LGLTGKQIWSQRWNQARRRTTYTNRLRDILVRRGPERRLGAGELVGGRLLLLLGGGGVVLDLVVRGSASVDNGLLLNPDLLLARIEALVRGVVLADTKLRAVGAAAAPDGAVVEEEEGVVLAASDLDDTRAVVLGRGEALDLGRGRDDVLVGHGAPEPALLERVEAPHKDLAVLVDNIRVVGARPNNDNVADAQALGLETVDGVARSHPASELALLRVAPDVNTAVRGQSQDVVGAADDIGKLDGLETGKLEGLELALLVPNHPVKAQGTLVVLLSVYGHLDVYSRGMIPRHAGHRGR
jgi:hypothetical protein